MFDLLCAILLLIPMAGLAFYIASIALDVVLDMIGGIIGGTLWIIRALCAGIRGAANSLMLRLRRRGQS